LTIDAPLDYVHSVTDKLTGFTFQDRRGRAAMAALALASLLAAAAAAAGPPLAGVEARFLEYLDAVGARDYVESGAVAEYEGRDAEAWSAHAAEAHRRVTAAIDALDASKLPETEQAALAAMERTLADYGDAADGHEERGCKDAGDTALSYEDLSEALTACYREHGNRIAFGEGTIDRAAALGLLGDLGSAADRKALFDAFRPLWQSINGQNEPGSPYRRLIRQAAQDAAVNGSEIARAASAIGVTTDEIERWLVRILEAWRDANPGGLIEPWDYRYAIGAAQRRLAPRIPPAAIMLSSDLYYRELGAELKALGVVYDIGERPDKSPFAYCDFLRRGRGVDGHWQPTIARVVGRYSQSGGLGAINELVHENGHAVHISAIRNRPAYTDWPDTLFTEAFADVPSWSVYEPAWQRKFLGAEVPVRLGLRAFFGSVMLDVAWSLFELRLLREPETDPNALWTAITQEYLRIRPHPELAWWAVRVQLVSGPGYMVNYGLGAVLTAEIRAQTVRTIGPFDAGNARWYAWSSERLLRFGSERSTTLLLRDLLGRPVSPDALLKEIRRIR